MKRIMKHLLMLVLCVTSVSIAAKSQTNGDAILGRWTNDDKTRVIEFVKTHDGYEAIIKEASDPNLVGQKQITEFHYSKNSYNGSLHLLKKGKVLPCTARINNSGGLELSAKAGFMSKSQTWTKAK